MQKNVFSMIHKMIVRDRDFTIITAICHSIDFYLMSHYVSPVIRTTPIYTLSCMELLESASKSHEVSQALESVREWNII